MILSFLFVAITTYQLMLSDIYARWICEKGLGKVTVVSVGLNVTPTGNVSYKFVDLPKWSENSFRRQIEKALYGGRLFRFSKLRSLVRKGERTCIFVFNDKDIVTNKILRTVKKMHSNVAVLLDEGISTYSDSKEVQLSIEQKIRQLYGTILGYSIQYRAMGDNPLIDAAFVSNAELYTTLKKAAAQKVFSQDRNLFLRETKKYLNTYYSITELYSRWDVIYLCGHPINNKNANSFEADHICRIIEMIPADKKIVIKPHPGDKAGKYDFLEKRYTNVNILNDNIANVPIECLINSIDGKIMIGHNSSALINIANMFPNIICCLTYRMPVAMEIQREWENAEFFCSYDESMFSSIYNNLFIPNTEQEFKRIFEYAKNDIHADECAVNNGFTRLIDYCIEKLDEEA